MISIKQDLVDSVAFRRNRDFRKAATGVWPTKENSYEISEKLISLSRALHTVSKLRSGRSQEAYQTQNDNKTEDNGAPGAQCRERCSSEGAAATRNTNSNPSTRNCSARAPHDRQFGPGAHLNRFNPKRHTISDDASSAPGTQAS